MITFINTYMSGFIDLLNQSIQSLTGSAVFDIIVVGLCGSMIIGVIMSLILRR